MPMAPFSPLPVRLANMVAVGIFVPIIFSLLDTQLFAAMQVNPQGGLSALYLFTVFVVQVGVFGVLAARQNELPPLRWGIYAWCWLLIDLQTLNVLEIGGMRYNDPSILLVKALYTAQAGLVLMWGILGTTPWVLRLPATVALVPLLASPLFTRGPGGMNHAQLFLAQLLALTLICVLLLWRRFKLVAPQSAAEDTPAELTSPGNPPPARRDLKRAQFGIRHVLIWTTSLAFALGLLRLLGLLSIPGISQLLTSQMLGLATAGTLIAIVLIVALWAGLGEGAFYLRWPMLVIACLAAGAALMYFDFQLARQTTFAWQRRLGRIPTWTWWDVFSEHWYWLAWTCLAGGLLFATLLMFRTLGYRLVRLRKGAMNEVQPA